MDLWLLILIIAAPILSVLGWVAWIVIAAVVAKKAMNAAARQGASGGFAGLAGQNDFATLMMQLEQSLRAASARQTAGRQSPVGSQRLTPQQQLQIQTMLMQAQNQMQQMDALSRQRYDTKMADLTGMAASAGIDWRP